MSRARGARWGGSLTRNRREGYVERSHDVPDAGAFRRATGHAARGPPAEGYAQPPGGMPPAGAQNGHPLLVRRRGTDRHPVTARRLGSAAAGYGPPAGVRRPGAQPPGGFGPPGAQPPPPVRPSAWRFGPAARGSGTGCHAPAGRATLGRRFGIGWKIATGVAALVAVGALVWGFMQKSDADTAAQDNAAKVEQLQAQIAEDEKQDAALQAELEKAQVAPRQGRTEAQGQGPRPEQGDRQPEEPGVAVQQGAKGSEREASHLRDQLAAQQAKTALATKCAQVMATGQNHLQRDHARTGHERRDEGDEPCRGQLRRRGECWLRFWRVQWPVGCRLTRKLRAIGQLGAIAPIEAGP